MPLDSPSQDPNSLPCAPSYKGLDGPATRPPLATSPMQPANRRALGLPSPAMHHRAATPRPWPARVAQIWPGCAQSPRPQQLAEPPR
jgi:hypothetical protein